MNNDLMNIKTVRSHYKQKELQDIATQTDNYNKMLNSIFINKAKK